MPDTSYRWIVLVYSLVIQAVNVGILTYCFALFSLPWIDFFEAPRRDVMLVISCLQIGMGLVSPWVGRWMDQVPMRNIVLLGGVCLCAGLWLSSIATALWQLWVIYATLMPLSTAMMGTLAAQTLMARWFVTQRGLALGISAMGTNIGGIIFPLLVAAMLNQWLWQDTLVYLAMMCAVLILPLTWWILRRQPPAQVIETDPTQTSEVAIDPDQKDWSTREILLTPMFWLPFLCLVPLNTAFGALQFNLGGLARDVGAADATALLIGVGALAMIAGKVFFGSSGDRLDHRLLFWIANTLMALALTALFWVESFGGLLGVVVLSGLAGGGILPMFGVIFSARFGARSFGRVMGLVMLSIMLGAAGPVLAGWSYDATGGYTLIAAGLLAVIAPAMIAMYWLPAPPSRG